MTCNKVARKASVALYVENLLDDAEEVMADAQWKIARAVRVGEEYTAHGGG